MNKGKYFVYIHIFPNKKKYIGITSGNIENRWLNGLGYATQKLMNNAIQKYGWENIKHKILYKNLSQNDACEKEIELIKKYKTTNHKYGYNISTGGEVGFLGTTRKGSGKSIYKYTIYGDYVENFSSIKNANIPYHKGNYIVYKGFIWTKNENILNDNIIKDITNKFKYNYKKCIICNKIILCSTNNKKYCDNCAIFENKRKTIQNRKNKIAKSQK